MVSGDVFRPPPNATLLAVQVGSGLQIISSAFITLLFAALGMLRHLCAPYARHSMMSDPCGLPIDYVPACATSHAWSKWCR